MDFAAILAVAAKAPSYCDNANIYYTDESGQLLIDGDGSLIVEG